MQRQRQRQPQPPRPFSRPGPSHSLPHSSHPSHSQTSASTLHHPHNHLSNPGNDDNRHPAPVDASAVPSHSVSGSGIASSNTNSTLSARNANTHPSHAVSVPQDLNIPIPTVGSEYPDFESLRHAVNAWALRDKFLSRIWKKDSTRAFYICRSHNTSGCKWRVRAQASRETPGKVVVTVVDGVHTCDPALYMDAAEKPKYAKRGVQYTQRWVKDAIARAGFVVSKETDPSDIVKMVRERYGEDISLNLASKSKTSLLKADDDDDEAKQQNQVQAQTSAEVQKQPKKSTTKPNGRFVGADNTVASSSNTSNSPATVPSTLEDRRHDFEAAMAQSRASARMVQGLTDHGGFDGGLNINLPSGGVGANNVQIPRSSQVQPVNPSPIKPAANTLSTNQHTNMNIANNDAYNNTPMTPTHMPIENQTSRPFVFESGFRVIGPVSNFRNNATNNQSNGSGNAIYSPQQHQQPQAQGQPPPLPTQPQPQHSFNDATTASHMHYHTHSVPSVSGTATATSASNTPLLPVGNLANHGGGVAGVVDSNGPAGAGAMVDPTPEPFNSVQCRTCSGTGRVRLGMDGTQQSSVDEELAFLQKQVMLIAEHIAGMQRKRAGVGG